MKTTLNEIKKHKPSTDSWEKLLKFLGKTKSDNRPLSFRKILKSNGLEGALWSLRVLPYLDRCMFSYDCAMLVIDNFESVITDDKRPRQAIEAVKDFKEGKINYEQLSAVWSAAAESAESAAWSEESTESAAWAAAAAAESARSEAWFAESTESAARSAARSATESAWSAAKSAAARSAAARSAAANKKIERLFIKHFG